MAKRLKINFVILNVSINMRQKDEENNMKKNPKYCQYCGKSLSWEKRRNKYCNSSCAAKENNKGVKRNSKETINNLVYYSSETEFKNIINNSKNLTETVNKLGYKTGSQRVKKLILDRCNEFNIKQQIKDIKLVKDCTKEEIFNTHKNWQSARSNIRRDAWKTFRKSGKEQKCCLCDYNKYIEIAHIKAVSDFNGETKISEINDIHNLVPLCPNHHWEFDHDCLSEEDINKIKLYSAMDQ